MENSPITLENILEQAPNWTFAGDFTLLQWMNRISQDLEAKANKTTEALSKLDHNVRSTNIALDNVANSLTTLQFGNQFVESRVQDDETFATVNEAISNESNKIENIPSSKDMLNTFLDNNLKILRNCYEKYSLDLDDSDDDEEGPNEKTCIYQLINPYNDRPLPFIFGSKDWYAKWHVGLFENQEDNNFSGDEISETFSESSNSATDDNESFESNTEWQSSNSVDNNNYNANIKVRNASSLRGSQPLLPGTPSAAINVQKTNITTSESSSVSTPSSSLAKKSIQKQKHHENQPTRAESINSVNSNASNRDSTNNTQAITKDKRLAYSRQVAPFVDLFAEPPEDIASITSSTHHKQRPSIDSTASIPSLAKSLPIERPALFNNQPPPFVDLFSEPPEDIPSTTSSSVTSAQNIKRKPLNLFDDDNNIESEDDLLARQREKENIENAKKTDDILATPKNKIVKTKTAGQGFMEPKNIVKPKALNVSTTPKSLFGEDDDTDDDDFLKAFAKKSSSLTKTSLTKTLLFDNDYDLISESPKKPLNNNLFEQDNLSNAKDLNASTKTDTLKESKIKKVNIFDDIEDDEDENALFKNVNKNTRTNVITNSFSESKAAVDLEKKMENSPKNVTHNLFDNLVEVKTKDEVKQKDKFDSFVAPAKKKINLFDDLEDDDYDFFATKSKPLKSQQVNSNLKQEHNAPQSLDKVTSDIFSGGEMENDSKSLPNKNISQDIVQKGNEATEKDLNFNAKEISPNENNNDQNLLKTVVTSSEHMSENLEKPTVQKDKSEFTTTDQEKELYLITDRPVNISKDQANKNIETLAKPQEEALKENINDELNNPLKSKELNDDNMATDTQRISENESTPKKTSCLDDEISSSAKGTDLSSPPTKYNFNSIMFLDEPPEDDSEFFETLAKTPKTLNTKYNSIDLEHDLYEPDLPTVPLTNTTISTVESADNRQPTAYTGLQLFSDVPPDDDDNDNTKSFASDSSLTTRLHSVFYDDFNETLAALNKNQTESISAHPILPKKQPPIKEVANISKDVVDHRPTAGKEELVVENMESKHTSNNKRPVSKLQLPNININVQALLPGAKTTLPKAKEDTNEMSEPETQTISNINKISVMQGNDLITKTPTILVSKKETVCRTAETEHILPNVTKNRVRAPITRRPSTRKARQDNYRKSLMEEEEEEQHKTSNETKDQTIHKKEQTNVAQQSLQVEKNKEKENTFSVENERNEDIFKMLNITTKSNVAQSATLNVESQGEVHQQTKQPTKEQFIDKSMTKVSSKQILTKEVKSPSFSVLFDGELEENATPFNLNQAPKLHKDIVQTESTGKSFKENNVTKPTTPLLFADDEEEENSNISKKPKDKIQTDFSGKSFVEKKLRKPTSSILFDDEEEDDASDFLKNIKQSVGATKNETKSVLEDKTDKIKISEKPLLYENAAKSTGSLLFDDENEDDDDFLKSFKSKDNKKATNFVKEAYFEDKNKNQSESTKSSSNESSDFLKKIKPLPTTVITQQAEGHTTATLPYMPSNISNLLPAKDSLSLEDQKEKHIPKLEANTDQIQQNKNSSNFLDDDYDDDSLFNTSNTTKASGVKSKESKTDYDQTQKPATNTMASSKRNVNDKKKNFVSFLDNESDDDFTVAGLHTEKSPQTTKPAPTPTPTTSSKTSRQEKANKSNSSKLFADSDTDSDDLFGQKSSKKTFSKPSTASKVSSAKSAHLSPKSMKTKPQSSLFSDDSDDDVEFFKSSGSVTKKLIPKSATKENKSKVTSQATASLFSDMESDEDDLFGGVGVNKPSIAATVPNVKTSATTHSVFKTTQTSIAKTSADNPLADLL